MPRIFISHASVDILVTEALRLQLVERGFDLFVDYPLEGILPAEDYKDRLAWELANAESLLCLVSPAWLASKECLSEWRTFEPGSGPRRGRATPSFPR